MANKILKTLRERRIDDIYYLFMSVLLHYLTDMSFKPCKGSVPSLHVVRYRLCLCNPMSSTETG